MNKRYFTALLCASTFAAGCFAQYDQSFSVEGKYVPEYINHDRIGVFPKQVRFPLEKSSLEYSLQGVNADFTPNAIPIQATGWQINHDYSNHRGYVELGLGSWLQSTLSAGYRIIDKHSSALGVRLQHNSTSLWRPKLSDGLNISQWRYDESIGLYGHHVFGSAGRLDAAVDYHLGNFNYYGYNPVDFNPSLIPVSGKIEEPTQTLHDVSGRVEWHSPSVADAINWRLGAGVRYFGYRAYYFRSSQQDFEKPHGMRETDINVTAGIVFPTGEKSRLGLDIDYDYLLYSNPAGKSAQGLSLPDPEAYSMLSLTPYYRFTKWKLNIQLGAKIDMAFGAGPKDDRYDMFHIAPSVRLDYDAGPVAFYLYALGGSKLHLLSAGYQNDYYQSPAISSTTPVYVPVDADLGASFGPFAGFHIGFDVAFRMARGQYFGGMYQLWLNGVTDPASIGLPLTVDDRPVEYRIGPGSKSNLNGVSLGLKTGYDAGRYFKIEAEGRYQPQHGKVGYFNGYDRPEWTADISAETNPWSTLKFKVGYQMRAMRMMPVEGHYADTSPLNSYLIEMMRLPNLSMLNAGASYGFTDALNVWVQADNLLCRRQYYMPGLPEPGLRLSAGLGFVF